MEDFDVLTDRVKEILGLKSTGTILIAEIIKRIIEGKIPRALDDFTVDRWIQAYREKKGVRAC